MLLYGQDEAMERMKKFNSDRPIPRVAIDHDFYTNNKAAARRKENEIAYVIRDKDGDSLGRETRNAVRRNKHAIGGVVKERRGFYD